jgi:hypothetical protein
LRPAGRANDESGHLPHLTPRQDPHAGLSDPVIVILRVTEH